MMALTDKQKNMVTALDALKQIGNHIGMYGRFRITPVLTDDEKYLSLGCVIIIADPKQSIVAKMACALMLDYYIPTWREIVGSEVLGNVVERDDKEVRAWRKQVLVRDNHKCAECESVENLEVHHIAHWALFPEMRLIEDNGTTLCNECHAKQHSNLSNLILSRVG